MWYRIAKLILKYRIVLLLGLALATSTAVYFAVQIKMSYDFTHAVPTDNEKYKAYIDFREKFGDDGNTVVIGIQTNQFFSLPVFNAYSQLCNNLKKIPNVEGVICVPGAIELIRNDTVQQFLSKKIFNHPYNTQADLDAAKNIFYRYPLYKNFLYNPQTNAYLMVVSLDKDSINSKNRTRLIDKIVQQVNSFQTSEEEVMVHLSGLPYLRTTMGGRIEKEMHWFLIGSLLLSATVLLIFFHSFFSMLMSLVVVGIGVIFSMATMVLLGYEITVLTALIPPLLVVIGIPNCIYFLNKYHTAYKATKNKRQALIEMIGRIGAVTLFCNIAAAIGLVAFAFTRSSLLKEFGTVSGINILLLFFISIFFIPATLSYLPIPTPRHVRYLENKLLAKIILKIEKWTFAHSRTIYVITVVVTLIAVVGIFRLRTESFVVDDLPKGDKIYTDLKWFEQNFNGVIPLEVIVASKNGKAITSSLSTLEKMDEISNYIESYKDMSKSLSLVTGLKFLKQAYYNGDSSLYTLPYATDMYLLAPYIAAKGKQNSKKNDIEKLLSKFVTTDKQVARISVNMKDVGTEKLPKVLADFENKSAQIFDTARYKVTLTGSSVTFLEGSKFIINGLRDSIVWAFVLIALCMLYLFRSLRILICSLIPNLIPLIVTSGVMGWAGIALKPSTVLVFSVSLGIAIDITIRFLINYKQELLLNPNRIQRTILDTIKHTGISIIYTSLVLVAGFAIFCFSSFGGSFALGWLTSLTLIVSTITNLILLPVLLLSFYGKKKK